VTRADFLYLLFLQPKVNVSFPEIGRFAFVDFDRGTPALHLALSDEYDTMNTASKLLAKFQLVALGISLCLGNKFVLRSHGKRQMER